jgi:PIN domain nuclease of toxin-antitoxin system
LRLLIDTAVLIFAVEAPEKLSRRATEALKNPAHIRELSSVSLVEIAVKTTLGKLNVSDLVARQAIADLGLRILPFTAEHAFCLFNLPVHHRDPFDRQIIAQALVEDIAIVTCDEKFKLYKGLKRIW